MITIIPAKPQDLIHVQSIAQQTWPDTFGKILSKPQIEYMLSLMYSLETLEKQMDEGYQFFLTEEDGKKLGFAGIEVNNEPNKTKIHKIYILPTAQGKGIGKKLIQEIKDIALANDQTRLLLNVNKYNQGAIAFYEYLGFKKIKEEVIDIGNGYVMDDFVFELYL